MQIQRADSDNYANAHLLSCAGGRRVRIGRKQTERLSRRRSAGHQRRHGRGAGRRCHLVAGSALQRHLQVADVVDDVLDHLQLGHFAVARHVRNQLLQLGQVQLDLHVLVWRHRWRHGRQGGAFAYGTQRRLTGRWVWCALSFHHFFCSSLLATVSHANFFNFEKKKSRRRTVHFRSNPHETTIHGGRGAWNKKLRKMSTTRTRLFWLKTGRSRPPLL